MLKKIEQLIEKHDVIFVTIIMCLGASIFALESKMYVGDELWNLSHIYQMDIGYTIYLDNNVFITPLFFYIGSIIFKIFGANFLVFKIYNIIIFTCLYIFSYILFKKLKIEKKFAFLGTLVVFIATYGIIGAGANYNILAIVLILLGMLIKFGMKENLLKNILHGIIIFLIFFTKQNIGVYYILGIIIYSIVQIVKTKHTKKYVKEIFIELFIAFIFLLIAILQMYIKGNLNGFIDYCVLGIAEFNKNLANNILEQIYTILEIPFIIILTLILNIIFKKDKDKKEKDSFLIVEGLILLLAQYPIFNGYHIAMSKIILIIYMFYILYFLLKEHTDIFEEEKIFKIINIVSIIILLALSSIHIGKYIYTLKDSEGGIYYGVKLSDEQKKDIKLICNYILEEKRNRTNVIILSYRAMAYTTPLNINNGVLDLPFLGNLGSKGEQGLVEKISKLKNAKILITKDEKDKIYQESELARKYVIENFRNVGEIGDFLVYKTTN